MTLLDAIEVLKNNEIHPDYHTLKGDIVRLSIYCSPILFDDKKKEIEDILGDEFIVFPMNNQDCLWIEKRKIVY